MSEIDHDEVDPRVTDDIATVLAAAAWLDATPRAIRRPAIVELKARFGLSLLGCVDAIQIHNRRLAARRP